MLDPLPLASEFPAATREQWLGLVSAVLKGAAYEQTLVARTYDGLLVDTLHARAADARPLPARAPAAPWQIMQRIEHPDASAANAEALHDLENGASGLTLVFAGGVGSYGFGLEPSEATLTRALDGIHLDAGIAIELDLAGEMHVAQSLASALRSRGLAPQAAEFCFGLDPLGDTATSWNELAPSFAGIVADLAEQGFKGPFAAADGRHVHAAGGSEAQELAFALGAAVAYLRALESNGIALDDARRMIFFRLVADADQFLTIAKFRALRKLWARIEEACGLKPQPAFVSAETAWRMMTRRDPWVNILRTTMATFAAGVGGANAITVLPFTIALGLPDRFARRLARNMQLILLEESNLAKVSDPAAGSGGLEDLTDQLCRAAWALFQEIEAEGGIAAALAGGSIQQKVAAVREGREKAAALRTDALTGTSEFPHLAELPVAVLAPNSSPLAGEDDRPKAGRKGAYRTILPRIRLAEPFERLRDASDRVLSQTGARPRVFLANLGTPAEFTARSTFAKNFFETGGIEAVTNDGFATAEDTADAFRASGAKLACLCSSDDIYMREAVAAAKALAAAGATHIYLAGRPRELEPAVRSAGVQTYIYVGCDVLATLEAAHDILTTT